MKPLSRRATPSAKVQQGSGTEPAAFESLDPDMAKRVVRDKS
jgi:hypothetical protein